MDSLAAARTGYLPVVGPAALRFAPAREVKLVGIAPPSQTTPVTAAIPMPTPQAGGEGATEYHAASGQSETAGTIGPATDESSITPQMLVEFFRSKAKPTASTEKSVLVPLAFTPPISNPPHPSSSATYDGR